MLEMAFALLRFAAPVGWAALGETVGQKSGVLNIGIEGMMLAAAFTAMSVSQSSGSAYVGVAAAVAVTVLIGAAQAWFILARQADQVVVGTATNLASLGTTSALFRQQFGTSGELVSVPKLPTFGEADALMLLLPLAAVFAAWWLAKSRWGLALRAAGEHPPAAQAAGHSVVRIRWEALLIGAALTGIGGAYLSLGITGSFAENMTAGRGFVALAMVTFGRWNPIWAYAASLLVGFAEQMQFRLQLRFPDLPHELFGAFPYLIALAVLIFAGRGSAGPAALGRPYRRVR